MKFVIDRDKWRCGMEGPHKLGEGETALLNEEGYMCCLGQVAYQCGIPADDLKMLGEPVELLDTGLEVPEFLVNELEDNADGSTYTVNSELSSKAIDINDSKTLTSIERENALVNLFREHGHEINFIGGEK